MVTCLLTSFHFILFLGVSHFKKKSSKLEHMIPSTARDFKTIFALATGTVDAPPIVAYDFDTYPSYLFAFFFFHSLLSLTFY